MTQIRYITVTALTKYIKKKFDVDPHLQDIWIKGELSNVKIHSRGHMYFTVKDEHAKIQAVMFAGFNRSLNFTPEDGMKVLLRGEVTVYEPSGNYQIYVKEMQPDGIGNLYLAFEELKRKLEAEGLFAAESKKPIPKYPKFVGVITSPTGAAIRDIITTIKRRYPVATVILIPALVQGIHAAPSIAKAIKTANELGYIDVLIVGRGGGSIEELWAFNEEIVAREIFRSQVPIISAVGHETDYTIADFVADLRAPTPTGAAELAVPHLTELLEKVTDKQTRLLRAMKTKLTNEKDRLNQIKKSYAFKYPKNLYVQKEQELDKMMERLEKQGKFVIERKREQWKNLSELLKRNHPLKQYQKAEERFKTIVKSLEKEMNQRLKEKQMAFQSIISKLDALSPLKIMERGYGLVYNQSQQLVKSVEQVQPGEFVTVNLKDGHLDCQIWGIEERKTNEQ
jgi:exodeoxyribonuclease VII large subunit